MKGLIILFILILLICCGVQALLEGDTDSAMTFLFLPAIFVFTALFFLAYHLFENIRDKWQVAIHTMYRMPDSVKYEYGEEWDKEFQKVIAMAIESTSDATKLSDLQHCQKVAEEMNKNSGTYTKDSPFNKINKAFRLTGCHLKIIDPNGNTITKVV